MHADPSSPCVDQGSSQVSCPAPAQGVRYDNLRDITRDNTVVGWRDIDYRQIEPGDLSVVVTAHTIGRVHNVMMQVNRCVEVMGRPSQRQITLIFPDAGHSFWANGFSIAANQVLLAIPDATLHIMARATRACMIQFPLSLLPEFAQASVAKLADDCRDGALALRLNTRARRSLRQLVAGNFVDNANGDDDSQSSLTASATRLIAQAIERSNGLSTSRSEPWRTISRAREYIEANLHQPIRMTEVSEYSAASVSKLERTFKRELAVTPSQYILARRLHAVNRDLSEVISCDTKVSDLAMQYGFTHLGRFSAAYRSHFGELPSQTLSAVLEGASRPAATPAT